MVVVSYATAHGATVQIADDYMLPDGSNEERWVVEEQRRIAHSILVAWSERESEHEKEKSA